MTVRWAFWRGRARDAGTAAQDARPLPDDVGLRTAATVRGASRDDVRDDSRDDEPADGRAAPASPFSGARPEAGTPPARPAPPAPVGPPTPDEAQLASSGPTVAGLVQAVLADARDEVRDALVPLEDPSPARAAAAAAVGALAARLPALSGVDGAVDVDEDGSDLLHAYADLLTQRAEHRRARTAAAVTSEQLTVVAHLAAAAALGDAAAEPTALVLAGIPAEQQLLAGCVLLAQTCADGGGEPDRLSGEITDLFGAGAAARRHARSSGSHEALVLRQPGEASVPQRSRRSRDHD